MKKTNLLALAIFITTFASAQVPKVFQTSKQSQQSVVVKQPEDYTVNSSSYYLQRSANKQFGAIVVTLSGAIIGGVVTALQDKHPTAGIAVISVTSVIGGILYISGVRDLKLAGIALERQGY